MCRGRQRAAYRQMKLPLKADRRLSERAPLTRLLYAAGKEALIQVQTSRRTDADGGDIYPLTQCCSVCVYQKSPPRCRMSRRRHSGRRARAGRATA